MTKTKIMPLYRRWMKTKKIEGAYEHCSPNGLCCSVIGTDKELSELLARIRPDQEERNLLEDEGFETTFWGSGYKEKCPFNRVSSDFTPLRQNLVLLMAAMNNEL